MKKITTLLFLSCSILPFFLSSVYAESITSITLDPEAPTPKSTVKLTLTSYYFDVNVAMITWKVNGVVILKGQGEKSLSVKTGEVGDSTRVTVLSETVDGTSEEQSINITPSSVILLYEAPKSYTPALYEGRSLPSDGAYVRVTAYPQISDKGVILSPSSLSYTWYNNDSVITGISGIAKQSANIRLDYLKNETEIKVLIRSPAGNTATKTITIYPHAVMPLIYMYDSIFGSNFTTLIEKRFETTQDFTLSLEPFYVSQKEEREPTFTWLLDGLPSTPLGGRLLSLHPKENNYGSNMLDISVAGPVTYLQDVSTRLELIYDTRK